MRGSDSFTEGLFSMRRLDDFVPANHPLRRMRVMVNEALVNMDGLFSAMYQADVKGGRPSVAPEKLLRAMLLQILFSIRSERQFTRRRQPIVCGLTASGRARVKTNSHRLRRRRSSDPVATTGSLPKTSRS